MTVAGIIAEYNPFHNGHKFHIEETRKRTGANFIIAAISGDFVQRGAPALLDKFLRTKMALENGIDLVLELPVTTALSSAEGFATGGVCLFEKLGVVDYLSFGCESAEDSALFGAKSAATSVSLQSKASSKKAPHDHATGFCSGTDKQSSLFEQVAKLLTEEPPAYRAKLQSYLKTGMSFPKARQLAVTDFFHFGNETQPTTNNAFSRSNVTTETKQYFFAENSVQSSTPKTRPNSELAKFFNNPAQILSPAAQKAIRDLLTLPNNTLALEYQKALYRYDCRMKTCAISRLGECYHDTRLSDELSSASAIRKVLLDYAEGIYAASPVISSKSYSRSENFQDTCELMPDITCATTDLEKILRTKVPTSVLPILVQACQTRTFLTENDFSDLLYYALLQHENHLSDFAPANSDLTNRIGNLLEQFTNTRQFTALLKSKNQTYTAISRSLFRILLGITQNDLSLAAQYQYAPYVRILGFRKNAAPLLKKIEEQSRLPIIRRPAKDIDLLNEDTRQLFALDCFASNLYRRIQSSHSGIPSKPESRQPMVIL